MSDEKKTIQEFFIEKANLLDVKKHLKGKTPIDILAIVRFDTGECHVMHPKDKIIRLGLMEDLKIAVKEI
ncbi:hypothetical protein LCGC14_1580330 [marine sediment metagenome]|uniref:Uncharacterized protein n=1 Tax=marine sediment metagenome TaxID=412755 RepID=A0A0F9J366_9ZZZZ